MYLQEFTKQVINRIQTQAIPYDEGNIVEVVFATIEEYEDLAVMYNNALIEHDFIYVNAKIEHCLQNLIPQVAS